MPNPRTSWIPYARLTKREMAPAKTHLSISDRDPLQARAALKSITLLNKNETNVTCHAYVVNVRENTSSGGIVKSLSTG